MRLYFFIILICFFPSFSDAQITVGAENLTPYLPKLKTQKVALVMNQASLMGNKLLVDTLLKLGVKVLKIFVPEHGFRGTADAGTHVNNSIDSATKLPLISLYGEHKKPTLSDLEGIDLVIYDLQDVGVRFYTYISTLQYVMEACAENNKKILILDRPNPNGYYVDGPVLENNQKSFVGMQKIPVVYGMTIGEYAQLLVGEQWFNKAADLQLIIAPCKGWNHKQHYSLRIPPSPNLKTDAAIQNYPSLCFFEGTIVSVGRGTAFPFEQFGHPDFKEKSHYNFTPKSNIGASKPLHEGKVCYGLKIEESDRKTGEGRIDLSWLIRAYSWCKDSSHFFNAFFEKLAGTPQLRLQIQKNISENEIRKSWQKDIAAFKKIRKKYLLYKDFE